MDAFLTVLGAALVAVAFGATCAALNNYAGPGTVSRDKKIRLAAYAVMAHAGMVMIACFTPEAHWAPAAIAVANIGMVPTYLGAIKLCLDLNNIDDNIFVADSIGEVMVALVRPAVDCVIFLSGLGILAAALYI